MNLEQLAYALPSTQAFVSGAASRIGVSVILLPDTVSREMVGRLIRRKISTMDVSVREMFDPPDGNPATVSAEVMGVSWQTSRARRNVANLLRCNGLPDVYYVHRIAAADSTANEEWIRFIEDWSEAYRQIREPGGTAPSLCVLAKLKDFPSGELPDFPLDVNLRWWLGFPSTLEMKLACRTADVNTDADETTRRWREHVLPSLVTSDVQLAEALWGDVGKGTESVISSLSDYWEKSDRPALDDDASELVALANDQDAGFDPSQGPPPELRRLWDSGGLLHTPEYGLEVHPGLLAANGMSQDVEHRLWRGQAELVLPIANEIRRRVCEELTNTFGDDWPTKWMAPSSEDEREAVKRSPYATELGHLNTMLSHTGTASDRHPLDAKRYLARLVSQTRYARNTVAHYEPITLEEFANLCEERVKVGI